MEHNTEHKRLNNVSYWLVHILTCSQVTSVVSSLVPGSGVYNRAAGFSNSQDMVVS